jgi:hypothetical protein
MNAGARYGLLISIPLMLLLILAPQPVGGVAVLGLMAVQLLVGAALVWRRTGLKYATSSMLAGAVGTAALAYLLATGAAVFSLSAGWAVALVLLLISGPVLFAVEARANPDKWQAWREFMEHKSVADMLRGRHIPHLR